MCSPPKAEFPSAAIRLTPLPVLSPAVALFLGSDPSLTQFTLDRILNIVANGHPAAHPPQPPFT